MADINTCICITLYRVTGKFEIQLLSIAPSHSSRFPYFWDPLFSSAYSRFSSTGGVTTASYLLSIFLLWLLLHDLPKSISFLCSLLLSLHITSEVSLQKNYTLRSNVCISYCLSPNRNFLIKQKKNYFQMNRKK